MMTFCSTAPSASSNIGSWLSLWPPVPMQQYRFSPPSSDVDTGIVPVTVTSPVLVGQFTDGGGPDVPVGVGVLVEVGVGVGVEPSVLTVTSSKLAEERLVWSPIRPLGMAVLLAVAIVLAASEPLMLVPLTVSARVYQVPVATVREALPSTVTAPLLTAWSCT